MSNQDESRMTTADSQMTPLGRHRIAMGMTQEELASKLNVTPSTVSLWESGKGMPRPSRIKKLAELLGVDSLTLTKLIAPITDTHPSPGAQSEAQGAAAAKG